MDGIRDRLAEWLNLLALITATAERIGHEIYNLQRPEIAEVCGTVEGIIGSITMPQKRNPQISEHLGTLARLVRHHAAHMTENLVHDHERDGRSWKGEWAIFPPANLACGKALSLLCHLLHALHVNEARMLENLQATKGFIFSERIMLALAPSLGKQSAHALVYQTAMNALERGITFQDAVLNDASIVKILGIAGIEKSFDFAQSTGCCAQMADRVLSRVAFPTTEPQT